MSHQAIHPIRSIRLILLLIAVAALVAMTRDVAHAARPQGASLEVVRGGASVPLPLLETDMSAKLQGDLATVRLIQVFENPYEQPLHARYIFPLPPDAAVYAMRLSSGGQMIEAEIQRKPEARAIFESAKQRGNQAALAEQVRPNVFTQEIANVLPGAPIRVELEYAHVVEKARGHPLYSSQSYYRFHFPMVVGPRFVPEVVPGGHAVPTAGPGEPAPLGLGVVGSSLDVWKLLASPPVAPPGWVDRERVAIRVELEAGSPIHWLDSPSHEIEILRDDRAAESRYVVTLAEGRTLDNKDFILHYGLAGKAVAAGATTFAEGGEGFVSLLLESPAEVVDAAVTARELVFVLDCSGSMSGKPLAASKRFMRRALPQLRASDSFRVIRFSDAATEWTDEPVAATPRNVQRGLWYVSTLRGGGGSVMTSGIQRALAPPVPEGAMRLVVFLTDGYIGNDSEIVRLLQQLRGDARFFSFGVGHSVNRYLMREIARVGRGAARIVLPTEDADAAADEFAARLASPVLTDVEIDWGEASITDVFPREIPDLFHGQSVRVMGRYSLAAGGERRSVTVRGRLAGKAVVLPIELDLPYRSMGLAGTALPMLWARARIEDHMTSYLAPGLDARGRDELEEQVTRLGLAHRLVTQWTSFVAVARPIVNPGGFGRHADVAVPLVEGLSELAYPTGSSPPGGTPKGASQGFRGNSAPEPETWAALLGIAAAAGLIRRRRRRNTATT